MHSSTLLLGLAALYTVSALPNPQTLTIGPLQVEVAKSLECTREGLQDTDYLSDQELGYAEQILEQFKASDKFSGIQFNPDNMSAVGRDLISTDNPLETYGYLREGAGDSAFGDVARGLEACKRDGKFAIGCHNVFGNGNYYICLRRK